MRKRIGRRSEERRLDAPAADTVLSYYRNKRKNDRVQFLSSGPPQQTDNARKPSVASWMGDADCGMVECHQSTVTVQTRQVQRRHTIAGKKGNAQK